ncbi:MAG: aminotransferase class V-fold PLP-dependent enzyme [Clostridium sp.]
MNEIGSNEIRSMFVGLDSQVTIQGGHKVVPINFDNAATTPVLKVVFDKIKQVSEYYGSIGRGLGQKSEMSTKMYEYCREYVLDFFNANKDKYTAVFVNNTTDGINKLSSILITDKTDIVITTRMEHHSNDLPWRHKSNVIYVEVDMYGRLNFDEIEELLRKYRGRVKYLTITAASNVTGYINDIHKIATIVHKYGAKIVVDGAQIVAHKKVSINGVNPDEDIDYFVFSGHKMYAPFGGGAIIGLKSELRRLSPALYGGGMVDIVGDYYETLLDLPEKDEAGSPNFFGAVALVESMRVLSEVGYDYIENHEKKIMTKTIKRLSEIEDVILYADCDSINDRVGIVVFNIRGVDNHDVALALAQFRGIAVRQGGFCAHPYIARLMNVSDDEILEGMKNKDFKMPGMVRISFGIYNTEEEVDILINILKWIINEFK